MRLISMAPFHFFSQEYIFRVDAIFNGSQMKARLWGTRTVWLMCCTVMLLNGHNLVSIRLNDTASSLIEVLEGLVRLARAVIYSSNVSLAMLWLSHFRNPHHLCLNSFDGNRACFCLFLFWLYEEQSWVSQFGKCLCVWMCVNCLWVRV